MTNLVVLQTGRLFVARAAAAGIINVLVTFQTNGGFSLGGTAVGGAERNRLRNEKHKSRPSCLLRQVAVGIETVNVLRKARSLSLPPG